MLRVKFADRKTAKAIAASLAPDNVDFPSGMTFQQKLESKELVIKISQRASDRQVETLISTLDEIVSHIQTAANAIEKTENL